MPVYRMQIGISTHTPLAGRDGIMDKSKQSYIISTHTPLAGRDHISPRVFHATVFLLTRPSRGATVFVIFLVVTGNISTHTPLAGRDPFYAVLLIAMPISTHTPLAGRDALGFLCLRTGI